MFRRHPYIWLSLIYWVIAGIIPLITLYIDFGYDLGINTYARHYPALFIYPLTFGIFSVYFLLRPFIFLLLERKEIRYNISKNVLIAIILISSVVAVVMEVTGKPAIWGVKKAGIETVIKKSNSTNNPQVNFKTWNDFKLYFKEPDKNPERSDYTNDNEYKKAKDKTKKKQKEYLNIISKTAKSSLNWSITQFSYFFSFFIQAFALISLFLTISFLSIFKLKSNLQKLQLSSEKIIRVKNKTNYSLVLVSVSLIFSSFWLLMRLSFENYKNNLYGVENISHVGTFIFLAICYLISFVYLTITLFISKEKTQSIINSTITILGTITVLTIFPKISIIDFDYATYIGGLMLFILIGLPWLIAYGEVLTNWDKY